MGYSPRGHKESGTTERLITNEIRTFTPVTNGNPVMGFPPLNLVCMPVCTCVCLHRYVLDVCMCL